MCQCNDRDKGLKYNSEAVVRRGSSKISVLENFADFTGKHLCWSLFLIKLQSFHKFHRKTPVGVSF